MRAASAVSRAPSTARVVTNIRKDYLGGEIVPNSFLPGERELASRYSVARVTVRRALQQLSAEGLVRAEPGRGYRALMRIAGLKAGSPAAYVVDKAERGWTTMMTEVSASFQRLLIEDGWQALTFSTEGRSESEVLSALGRAGVWGVAIDSPEDWVYQAIYDSGIPCVSVDRVCRELPIDNILQDNHGGGMQAASYLIDRGHRKIGWFGAVGESTHSAERFTGAQAAFLLRGLEMPSEYVFRSGVDLDRDAREMLARSDRPTAVMALWSNQCVAVGRAARVLGLELGKDLDLVGWSTELDYRSRIERDFGPGKAPPIVMWSTAEMSRIAITRLLWHVREPNLKPLRVSVPTRLVTSSEEL